jgi:hypothetical protein
MENNIYIDFPDVSPAEAGQLANDLRDYLQRNAGSEVKIVKSKIDTMDFGATLAIILGAAPTLAIARALGNWLLMHQQRKITVKKGQFEVEAENFSSKDVSRLLDKLNDISGASGEK